MTKKATFICGGVLVPASRFRVHPISRSLESEGWKTTTVHGYGALDQRIKQPILKRSYRAISRTRRAIHTSFMNCDGPVLVQRLALPWLGAPEARLADRNGSLVLDFDDAVFLGGSGRENVFRRRALNCVFNHAAHVVAGNTWLAEHVAADVPISVIPTCIDTNSYLPLEDKYSKKRLRIGWMGTSSNFHNLWQLEKPLEKLRLLGFQFDFVICSDAINPGLFRRLGAVFVKWTPEGELPLLQSLDIGIMPLIDNDWNKGKCSFKMIQYMSVGCPTVASAIGMNIDVLGGDVGGRLVLDENWVDPLAELLASRNVREQTSFQARSRAIEKYDLQVAVEKYKNIFLGMQS